MPEQRITKEAVLAAALDIVRKTGYESLTAREIANQTGCSVQPIYSLFGDMTGLVDELYEYSRLWVIDYNVSHAQEGVNLFEANGFSHLRLAKDEKNLFHFLYLSPHLKATSAEEMFKSTSQPGVEECIQELGGLSVDDAHELYLNMIIFTHGLAAFIANGAQFSDEELHSRIYNAFKAFAPKEG